MVTALGRQRGMSPSENVVTNAKRLIINVTRKSKPDRHSPSAVNLLFLVYA